MSTSEEIELFEAIEKSFDIKTLQKIIFEISVAAWDHRMERSDIKRWLKNFDGRVLKNEKVEQIIAAWLLMNFTFYTEKEVRVMCKCIFEDFIHKILHNYEIKGFMLGEPINTKIDYILQTTLFLPLGNISESGANILYYFRQENALPKTNFEYKETIDYENIVYIDDVTASGSQAGEYISNKNIKVENKFILTLIATDKAIDYLKSTHPEYNLITSIMLDDRSKCFAIDSFVFSGANSEMLKTPAHNLCFNYGKKLCATYPLGYNDGQYLFGFFYNTPDNTLPIIWSSEQKWVPSFLRYHKKYERDEVNIDESKFF